MRGIKECSNKPVTISLKEVATMYGIGLNTAARMGAEAGARVKMGRRVLYRIDKLNAYIDELTEAATAQDE